jgi:hypothetical protein
MLKKIIVLLILFISIQIFYSCSSSTTESKRIIENKFWTDTDSEAVSDSLVNEILNLNRFTSFKKKQKLKIVVGKITNLSNENTNSDLIEKDIERSFISSGKVTFIPSKTKREEIRSNRKSTSDFTNEKEFKKYLINPIKKKYKLSLKVTDSKNLRLVTTQIIVITK